MLVGAFINKLCLLFRFGTLLRNPMVNMSLPWFMSVIAWELVSIQ